MVVLFVLGSIWEIPVNLVRLSQLIFNSYIFVFTFLPTVLFGFHVLGNRGHHRIAISWLVAASIVFYGWWNPAYIGLIIVSILFNYAVGVSLSGSRDKRVLMVGVAANLSLLGYYKYANFFVDSLNAWVRIDFFLENIVLPLAISFFTFQQIAYLIDAYRGETREYNFLHYCLFVTFFPQLIAGPIVHHREMLPQFADNALYRIKASHFAVGMTIFVVGLLKKTLLADGVAIHATPVFQSALDGNALTFFEAWGGALAYTLQIYFDFSGYSDMAIGIARMFGVTLPVNFFSPYKARNIIEFWKRWHITLSRFLRDYLYITLGGNRKGHVRRYFNLMVTMLLGGLWHGAGWTFVAWGVLHGSYIVINHMWIYVKATFLNGWQAQSLLARFVARGMTFLAVIVAWVMFRAESFDGAMRVYEGMLGMHGFSLPTQLAGQVDTLKGLFPNLLITADGMGAFGSMFGVVKIVMLLLVAWFFPNTLEWIYQEKPALGLKSFEIKPVFFKWRANVFWAMVITFAFFMSLLSITEYSEFLYFQF